MKKPGDKTDIIDKAIAEKKHDEIWVNNHHFPKQTTLVVNPVDPSIPEDQKVVIDKIHTFGHELFAFVRYKGAAKLILGKNDEIGYQVAVIPSPYTSPDKGRVAMVTDPVYLKGNDIQLALDKMSNHIKEDLIPEFDNIMREDIKQSIQARKNKQNIDKRLDGKIKRPFFLHKGDSPGKGIIGSNHSAPVILFKRKSQ